MLDKKCLYAGITQIRSTVSGTGPQSQPDFIKHPFFLRFNYY